MAVLPVLRNNPHNEVGPPDRSPRGRDTTYQSTTTSDHHEAGDSFHSSADQCRADLAAEANAIRGFPASIITSTDIGAHAVEWSASGWPVFPLRDKTPAVRNPHPEGSPERRTCKGECGQMGHGVHDATTDVDTVIGWWSGRFRGFNIGARIPDPLLMIDIDPRHGGDQTWAALEAEYRIFPDCMMQFSGRGDGGTHRFVRKPAGKLSIERLNRWAQERGVGSALPGGRWTAGIDLKTSSGYAVMAPSIHPDSGKPYTRVDGPIVAPPDWFIEMVTVPAAPVVVQRPARTGRSSGWEYFGGSLIDRFNVSRSWGDVLEPHGWTSVDGDPDGARWLHPAATSKCSATVSDGSLYVYSTNTPFDVTEAEHPKGYSKFAAYAELNHRGDMKAAAQALKGVV